MRASIVSVGSEILRGSLLDTNAQYFAQQLHSIGATVVEVTQVPDNLDSISDTLRRTSQHNELTLVTGGLGPTDDDLTREAIAAIAGETPEVDDLIVEEIRARFRIRGDDMPQRNEKQAWKIPAAEILPNIHGTAPGWFVTVSDATIVAMPGPPRENRPMWRDIVLPLLLPRIGPRSIVSRTIKTIGIGESAVADLLDDVVKRDWPEVGTYAKSDGVHVVVTADDLDHQNASNGVREVVDFCVGALGPHIYGFGDETLAAAITEPLRAAAVKLAVWEAGAGGTFTRFLMENDESAAAVGDARVWSDADQLLVHEGGDVRRVAQQASIRTGLGTAIALTVRSAPSRQGLSNGSIELAFIHAGEIAARQVEIHASVREIHRRCALLAAEMLWFELRSAAGIPQIRG